MGVERRVYFVEEKKGEGEETHTHTHTLVELNKLIDCSSWWEEEVALTQAEADWPTVLHKWNGEPMGRHLKWFFMKSCADQSGRSVGVIEVLLSQDTKAPREVPSSSGRSAGGKQKGDLQLVTLGSIQETQRFTAVYLQLPVNTNVKEWEKNRSLISQCGRVRVRGERYGFT